MKSCDDMRYMFNADRLSECIGPDDGVGDIVGIIKLSNGPYNDLLITIVLISSDRTPGNRNITGLHSVDQLPERYLIFLQEIGFGFHANLIIS